MNNSTNFIESEDLVARMFNNFGVDQSGLEGNVFSWLGELLRVARIRFPNLYAETRLENVVAYKLKLPCAYRADMNVDYYPNADTSLKPVNLDMTNNRPTRTSNRNIPRIRYFYLTPQYLHFSFETGIVDLYYKKLPLGSCGLPMLPDNEHFLMAAEWHIMFRLLSRGYKHPTYKNPFELIEAKRQELRAAQVELKSPGRQELRTFDAEWLTMLNAYTTQYSSRDKNISRILPNTNIT